MTLTLFYSESTNAFYDTDIHGDAIPTDSVEISKQYHSALLDGQSQGKLIVADAEGYPVLVDRPPLSTEDQIIQDNAVIVRQIEEIEQTRQPRALREATLNGDLSWLEGIEQEIATLRAQLQ